MGMKTINDDVDRQVLVHKLIAGEATQEERDQALATVMLSLWNQQELKDLIRMVHKEECDKCPLKEHENEDTNAWRSIAMKLVQYGGWIILIVAALLKVKLPL